MHREGVGKEGWLKELTPALLLTAQAKARTFWHRVPAPHRRTGQRRLPLPTRKWPSTSPRQVYRTEQERPRERGSNPPTVACSAAAQALWPALFSQQQMFDPSHPSSPTRRRSRLHWMRLEQQKKTLIGHARRSNLPRNCAPIRTTSKILQHFFFFLTFPKAPTLTSRLL